MAFANIDLKLLGRFARKMQGDHPLLAQSLFQILGLLTMLSARIIRARKLKELGHTRVPTSVELYHKVLWYAREGLKIVEEYIFPMVVNYQELKVLAYKLRASFYHIYVLFNNQPPIHLESYQLPSSGLDPIPEEVDNDNHTILSHSRQSMHHRHHHPVGEDVTDQELDPNFLVVVAEYRPITLKYFQEAKAIAELMLSGSHPLRLSVNVEFAAFLYDCVYDKEGSRKLAATAIKEVYNSQEGMGDDTFEDAIQLVTILGKMVRRGEVFDKTTEGCP
ncbi:hypothetical protein K3495_g2756 [Podosphaera aphanis]|nr:hypothetical protein K3495_g2756 [Podosphaera aphanis]